ncbi:quercetin dioxygenase-like cupin family protein [Sedimentibacter acidaminivorans]|jgi:quercetin dioxygenase-like cupin family protein|uniref:Quercetin dioxygenase-like cupin family protein n=1 Tax=Sedimentibacter acidaminivorans TaxID=913099 RepID=A0ABS4GAL8_9FIRM|nr:cupin domain-containing protein [Sedimentibacter acidaminivorans]MBP1924722.1 quercetin dioxygenase-like cupin family protein [Sedimentibacter acidaminivorans]
MDFRNLENSIEFSDDQLIKRIIFSNEQILSFVLNLKRGQTLPVHEHENSSVVLNVLQGKGELQINDKVQKLQKGSAALANGKDKFGIPLVEENLSLFVTISPRPNDKKFAQEIG